MYYRGEKFMESLVRVNDWSIAGNYATYISRPIENYESILTNYKISVSRMRHRLSACIIRNIYPSNLHLHLFIYIISRFSWFIVITRLSIDPEFKFTPRVRLYISPNILQSVTFSEHFFPPKRTRETKFTKHSNYDRIKCTKDIFIRTWAMYFHRYRMDVLSTEHDRERYCNRCHDCDWQNDITPDKSRSIFDDERD